MIEKGICMADGKTGAIILAAGRSAHMEELKPMLRMGQTTMIQREIDTIRQAGISPIVVVTGYQADVLERHISHRGAVCIRNKRYETSQMYGSICMGLRHIQKKADRVLLFPADVPMITADTIEKMAQAPGSMAVPVCQGKKGHPVMLSKEVFGHILTYRGGKGLRGAMDAWGEGVREIEVEDPGVLLDTNTKMDYESLLAYEKDRQKRGELAFQASISLSREEECFSALTADFLVPMITADTIEKMAQAPGSMAVPVCQGKKGHPVMLSKEVFGHILTYRGGKGLRGAMDAWGEGVREIEVEDPGVLLDTNTKMDYESLLAYEKDRQKRGELAFQASISLSREEECFSALTADFLEAVAESGSMLGACQIRDISYSKGWKMLKIAEAQLGIQFLERQTGGSKGGFSVLTPEGKAFLEKFRRMEAAVQAAAEAAFEKIFLEPEEEEKEDTDGREINAF